MRGSEADPAGLITRRVRRFPCNTRLVAGSHECSELPLIQHDYANNFVAEAHVFLFQDTFPYNAERSRGDAHNIIAVIMHDEKLGLQGAVDRAVDMCRGAMDKYIEAKANFSSYDVKIDKQVAAYMHGLESWMSGCIEWSFIAGRYFKFGDTRLVKLLQRPNTVIQALGKSVITYISS